MRPVGEISLAIMRAASELAHVDADGAAHGPTLRELAHKACVGMRAARMSVDTLRRGGKLAPVAQRRVAYRNRPVAEYAPADTQHADETIDVASVFAVWAQG